MCTVIWIKSVCVRGCQSWLEFKIIQNYDTIFQFFSRATTNKKMKETVALELSFVNSNLQLLKEQLAELNSSVELYQNRNGWVNQSIIIHSIIFFYWLFLFLFCVHQIKLCNPAEKYFEKYKNMIRFYSDDYLIKDKSEKIIISRIAWGFE